MLSEIWKHRKEILEGVTNTLLKSEMVEDIAKDRVAICNKCDEKKTEECAAMITSCCNICGCSLEFKTRSLKSACPINKWPALEE
jgi:hypothetical protein